MSTFRNDLFASAFVVMLFGLLWQSSLAKTSTILGSTFYLPQEEIDADLNIAHNIEMGSLVAGYQAYNWYGEATNSSNVFAAANGVGHAYSISFFIGHGEIDEFLHYWGWPWQWHWHSQYYIVMSDGSWVHDCDIFDYSSSMRVRFDFLWSCRQGDTIGSLVTYPCGEQKAKGMPLAWLHTSQLGTDGYGNPDHLGRAFAGFQGLAPFLTYDGFGSPDACHYFLWWFYYMALHEGYYYSVNDALDFAAQYVWGVDFGDCILHTGYTLEEETCKMIIYGDGSMHISSHSGEEGGCPTLFVWDGEQYAEEETLNIHAMSDVTVDHSITHALVPENGSYKMQLRELDAFTSHIDSVRLFALGEDGSRHTCKLLNAQHSELGRVRRQLLRDDGIRTDLEPTQVIELSFNMPGSCKRAFEFVFEINGFNSKTP